MSVGSWLLIIAAVIVVAAANVYAITRQIKSDARERYLLKKRVNEERAAIVWSIEDDHRKEQLEAKRAAAALKKTVPSR